MVRSNQNINSGIRGDHGLNFLLVLFLLVGVSPYLLAAQSVNRVTEFSIDDFSGTDHSIYISDTWRFQAGDNIEWARPSYPDSSWQKVSTYLGPNELPFIEWEGIGWFRMSFKVDSSLIGYPLALIFEQHHGASEIYLDGKKIYTLGEVSSFEEDYRPYRDNKPRPLYISDNEPHVLAVRYANHDTELYNDYGFTSGFRFLIGDLNQHIDRTLSETTATSWAQLLFAGGLVAFTIIHFLLFAFYPAEKKNLYFALFTFFLALLSYSQLETIFSDSPLMVISYYRFYLIATLFAIIYALRFTYSLFSKETPAQFWGFLAVGIFLAATTWFNAEGVDIYRELFVLLTMIEIIRALFTGLTKSPDGSWIIGTGLSIFAGGILFSVMVNLDLISGDPMMGNIICSSGLIFAMSIYLSRDIAKTQKRLEHKLIEVKHLSERSLEQERVNKKKELERKLLAAENERKSRELEEARALQLSMLPKQIPQADEWDIAVFMETAQEVGGDYYDFSESKNGDLTVALGDATGHGMKAGIMVATAKSYFHTLANEHDNIGILQRMSSGIRNMDLRMMYMGFMLLKCDHYNITFASAGMPPILHYDATENKVHEILLKGMPLGSKVDFPYKKKNITLQKGDCLLLMSDGLMELFNKEREQLGLSRIKRTFREAGNLSASDIMSQVTRLIDQWAGSKNHEDDITILVMKTKSNL